MTPKRRIEKLESRPRPEAMGWPRVSRKVIRVLLGWTKYGDLPLTPEEESQREAFAAYLEARRKEGEEQRTKALELLAEGKPVDEISDAVGTNPGMVRRWEVEDRWEKAGPGTWWENRRAHHDSLFMTDKARADAREGVASQHAISPVQTPSRTPDTPEWAPKTPEKARTKDVRKEFLPRRGPETAYQETMRELGVGFRRPKACAVCQQPTGFPRAIRAGKYYHPACQN